MVIVPSVFNSLAGRVTAGMSTRVGGISPEPLGLNLSYRVGDEENNVRENRHRFLSALGGSESKTSFAAQCHSATVTVADVAKIYPSCDALITTSSGLGLAVSIADCVPILIADRNARVVAAVHAGWRGTHAGILKNTLEHLYSSMSVGMEDMMVWIGPCASRCCYEVGEEVAKLFHADEIRIDHGRTFLDLKMANSRIAQSMGVTTANIEVDSRCTICSEGIFHSFRRDGTRSGRMLSYIRLHDPTD